MTASISLSIWCNSIWCWWGLCWQRPWVCGFEGVLHQGLPVRHQLGWSWEVKGQRTRGWCHWWQHPWHAGRQLHRWGSRWSLCLSWAAHTVGQSRWTGQQWKNLGTLPCLRTHGVQWHLLALVGCVPSLNLGGHHQHHKDSKRNWSLGALLVFLWVEH